MGNLSLIIPAHNEENHILKTIQDYSSIKSIKEIVVICDGTDNTARVANNNKNNKITVLEYNKRLGKGGAIIEGLKKAKCEFVGYVDADGSIPYKEYEKLINKLINSEDHLGIVGSRFRTRSKSKMPLLRIFLSRSFNILVNTLFCLDIEDTQCGAKIFKKTVIDKIIPKLGLTGWAFDVELLFRSKQYGKIAEEHIEYNHRMKSKIDIIKTPLKMFLSVIRLWLILRTPLPKIKIPRWIITPIYRFLNDETNLLVLNDAKLI
ncbi:MAG: glycosyltransferase [Candidatus Micrarchaeota archaeon]